MPNRIIREGILSSQRVEMLSVHAEVFYRRLLSAVDDFGRFEAVPMLLLARLYPLRCQTVKPAEIEAWLRECQTANLVLVYHHNGAPYLEVVDFRQQRRAKTSKFPDPPETAQQTRADEIARVQMPSDAHLDVCEDVDVCEGEGEKTVTADAVPSCPAEQILEAFNSAFGRSFRMTAGRRKLLRARWKDSHWRQNWQSALQRAGPSAFLNGQNDRGWQASLDWFLRPDTVTKILEGAYDNRTGTNGQTRRLSNAEHREQANADAFEAVFGSGPGVADAVQYEKPGSVHAAPVGHLGGRAGAVPD